MKLAIFDLDNTLLTDDSDYQWGQFIVEHDYVDRDYYEARNKQFHADYEAGTLDINEFLRFTLEPLKNNSLDTLQRWHKQFMQEKILPIIPQASRDLLAKHRAEGHFLLIITATNEFITGPIAEELGVDHIIATRADKTAGGYTGESSGTPCFQNGKITRLQEWLEENHYEPEETWFYSDSHNDIPLLEQVDHPIAVNADAKLQEKANLAGWPSMKLKWEVASGQLAAN